MCYFPMCLLKSRHGISTINYRTMGPLTSVSTGISIFSILQSRQYLCLFRTHRRLPRSLPRPTKQVIKCTSIRIVTDTFAKLPFSQDSLANGPAIMAACTASYSKEKMVATPPSSPFTLSNVITKVTQPHQIKYSPVGARHTRHIIHYISNK